MTHAAFEHARVSLHPGRMLLTPTNPMAQTPLEPLSQQLQGLGLLGTVLNAKDHRYRSGPYLFELVAFTGCAVQLDTNATASAGLEVQIQGPFTTPQRRSGRNTRPPRCPHCRRPLANWQAQREGSERTADPECIERLSCEGCGLQRPGWAWNWGRHAGYGRVFICLEPIFPGEARPLPRLLNGLETLGLGPWHHFYTQG